MFRDMPQALAARMRELERPDGDARSDGKVRIGRIRQIPSEAGRFIALLAAAAPRGRFIEVGTSSGYATLWLALACRAGGRRVTTFEVHGEKASLAKQTFSAAEVGDVVDFVRADALSALPNCRDIAFCLMDAEDDIHCRRYEAVISNMVPGGILVADNAANPPSLLRPMLDRALNDDRVDALIVPIGNGVLLCRKK